jgi:hypothetical protein
VLKKPAPADWLWERLIQRIDKTIREDNFPDAGPAEHAMLIVDGANPSLRATLRKMRRFNVIGLHGNQPLLRIVEDPVERDSRHSYFIQAADVNAFFLYQREAPNRFIVARGARLAYQDLDPVICRHVNTWDAFGVIRVP